LLGGEGQEYEAHNGGLLSEEEEQWDRLEKQLETEQVSLVR
jgi:hypothetical protein